MDAITHDLEIWHICSSGETGSGHPGHPGLTRFTIYPGLTRIGSREKRNCSFDDVELINDIA